MSTNTIFIIIIILLSLISLFSLVWIRWYMVRYIVLKTAHETYDDTFKYIQTRIEYIKRKLKDIDVLGHFESDDEIGFFFTEVKMLALLLEEFAVKYYNENADYQVRMDEIKNELEILKQSE